MAAHILHRYQRGDREQLVVEVQHRQYQVWLVPLYNHNGEVSAWRAWSGLAHPTHATAEDALAATIAELQQLHEEHVGE